MSKMAFVSFPQRYSLLNHVEISRHFFGEKIIEFYDNFTKSKKNL